MKNKNILIIGGSGLIGYTLYKKLKENNYNVFVADIRNTNKIKNDFFKVNAYQENSLKNLIKKLIHRKDRIDVIINSVYSSISKKKIDFWHQTKEDFLKKINLHIGTNFLINKLFINYFKKIKKGNIIHISSIYGSFIPRFEIYKNLNFTMPLDYLVCKSSMNYMTRYVAKLLLGSHITVNNISPGGIFDFQEKKFLDNYSKFTNHKSMLQKEDLYEIVEFLIKSNNLKITGQNFLIDDGFTL
jgi:NAD(P)-dependent dehydrogenase (short-subunit alcohol dehydrogenase family)